MNRTRVLIVDDHVIARQGIRMFLSTDPSIQIVGEAEDGQDAVDQVQSLQPDVVLIDLLMPERAGIEAIAEIKRCIPTVKVIVLTAYEGRSRVRTAMQAGADGYLLKDADGENLLEAINAVQCGDTPLHPRVVRYLPRDLAQRKDPSQYRPLTAREKEVLRLVANGLSNREMAQVLNVCMDTTKVHVSHILSKLNVSSRTEAAVLAMKLGLIWPRKDK